MAIFEKVGAKTDVMGAFDISAAETGIIIHWIIGPKSIKFDRTWG